ncbi:unnamed protein product [Bursaphelenchus xylophilus]|uniref:(pine wood nematode) hypothetical protein n=1 Tax=Bursaphelenchus xylophilus TaxID=6326 RepID=A0A1I7SBA1_BURXY|nr:unnamed protein product [Bursaphelenchus xylophilus]CAG9131991.1 unnamed protein product [Bursaphelenchus xylophilus]
MTLKVKINTLLHFKKFGSSTMLTAPAAERNKGPILEVIQRFYPQNFVGKALEIASGTGSHVIHFASNFPNITFQPSECNPRNLHSIVAHVDHFRLENVRVPLFIDVAQSPDRWALPADFGPSSLDLMVNVNMLHISSNSAVEGLFRSAEGLLKTGGRLFVYDAFGREGRITPESNVRFNESLKRENPEWGLRFIEDLSDLALRHSLILTDVFEMPAHNHTLVFQKQ